MSTIRVYRFESIVSCQLKTRFSALRGSCESRVLFTSLWPKREKRGCPIRLSVANGPHATILGVSRRSRLMRPTRRHHLGSTSGFSRCRHNSRRAPAPRPRRVRPTRRQDNRSPNAAAVGPFTGRQRDRRGLHECDVIAVVARDDLSDGGGGGDLSTVVRASVGFSAVSSGAGWFPLHATVVSPRGAVRTDGRTDGNLWARQPRRPPRKYFGVLPDKTRARHISAAAFRTRRARIDRRACARACAPCSSVRNTIPTVQCGGGGGSRVQ